MYNGIALKPYLLERLEKLRADYVGALKDDNVARAAKCVGGIEELQVLLERLRKRKVK